MIVKDNYSDAAATEQDPIAFVYIPKADVGTKRLFAMGRVNGDASTDVSGGTFTVTKSGTGQWYLSIPSQSNTTGVLLISPENGGTNTRDNIVSYQWDGANSRWIIESRDINGTGLPTLQDVAGAEDVFSFAFFKAPDVPVVALSSPSAGSTATANATFTLEATATRRRRDDHAGAVSPQWSGHLHRHRGSFCLQRHRPGCWSLQLPSTGNRQ